MTAINGGRRIVVYGGVGEAGELLGDVQVGFSEVDLTV